MGTPPAATAIHLPLSLMSDVPSGGVRIMFLSLSLFSFHLSMQEIALLQNLAGPSQSFFHFVKGERERVEGREMPLLSSKRRIECPSFFLPRKRTIPPFFSLRGMRPTFFRPFCITHHAFGAPSQECNPPTQKGLQKKISQSSSPSANEKKFI